VAERAPAHSIPFLRLPNGSRELLVPSRGKVSKVLIHPTKQSTFDAHRPAFRPPPNSSPLRPLAGPGTAKVGINKEFFRQLKAILMIIIPRKGSKEVALVIAHTSFLLLRTYLSLLVAQLDGKLVGDLVSLVAR
jgi:ATP-binding cassette subfamily D (ALD) long-chain fatty acid import protein